MKNNTVVEVSSIQNSRKMLTIFYWLEKVHSRNAYEKTRILKVLADHLQKLKQ